MCVCVCVCVCVCLCVCECEGEREDGKKGKGEGHRVWKETSLIAKICPSPPSLPLLLENKQCTFGTLENVLLAKIHIWPGEIGWQMPNQIV